MRCKYLIVTTVAISCLLVLAVGCQEQAKVTVKPQEKPKAPELVVSPSKVTKTPEPCEPAPKIMFEKVVHDFGEVAPGAKGSCEFRFTNAGEGVLKIINVQECCGCSSRLSKKEYKAGESGTLVVECTWPPRPAVIRRQVYVDSNDKTNQKFRLTIGAKIVQKVTYEPERLNLLLRTDANCPAITLTSTDGKPFSIKQFKSTGNSITADIDTSVEATKFVLQPKVDAEKLRKGLNGIIEIELTHPDCGTITIPFNTLAVFEVNPPMIILFNAEALKPIQRDVWVLNNYGEDFEIESTSSQNNIIKVLSQQKVRNGYQLKLEITPPAATTNQRLFTDTFSVNIKGGEKLVVTCRGFYPTKPAGSSSK